MTTAEKVLGSKNAYYILLKTCSSTAYIAVHARHLYLRTRILLYWTRLIKNVL